MAKVCSIGIKRVVKDMTKNKPWYKYQEDSDFIQVLVSPNKKINERNLMGVAITTANALNKSINRSLPIGEVFVAQSYSDGTVGVLINPTNKQLQLLNAKEESEIDKLVEEVQKEENEKEARNLADIERKRGGYTEKQKGEFFQLRGGTMATNASPRTIAMIKDFLKRIGVSTQNVDSIIVNGVQMDANAAAIVTQKLIQVVNGMEARALPEEAMHFAVEIIKQTNPKLYQKLLSEINSYQILKDTFAEYSNNPLYQTQDGKPNVLKIKDEAIGKVLSETIIYQNENNKESAEKLAKVQGWWAQILEWLKGLFSRSGFDQAAMDIIAGKEIGTANDIRANENEVFLQQSKQEQIFNTIKRGSMSVEKRGDGYYVNGKKVPKRVTDLVNDWYKRRFDEKDLTKTEFQKAIDSLKADKGTAGHADLEYAFNVYVDPETGLMRSVPLDDSAYVSQLNDQDRKYYTILRDNLKRRLDSFGPNARFLAETVVYDAKRPGGAIAGTIDFIAITQDGKVNILDWKFTNLNTNKYEDVPWYKVNAWRTQMNQYKLILKTAYGIKEDQFGQTRMIPIQAVYTEPDYKKEILPRLSSIKIGDVDIKNIQEDYLLPVGLEEEATGQEELDEMLAKLNRIYKRMSEKKVTPDEKITKAEQLNSLFKAIRHLQMRRDSQALLYQARLINKQIDNIFTKFDEKFKGKDPALFTEDDRSDFTKEIEDGLDALDTYADLATELDFLFTGTLDKATENLRDEIYKTSARSKLLRSNLLRLDKNFTNDFIAMSEKVKDAKKGEKSVTGASKWFSSTATLQIKSAQVLFRKANRAFTYAGQDTAAESRRLLELKKAYDTWARGKGLTNKNYFDIIRKKADSYQKEADARKKAEIDDLNKIKSELSSESYKQELDKIEERYQRALKDKNELIDEFDPQFYSRLKSAQAQKDYKWIRDNVDRAAYTEHLRKKLDIEQQRILDKPRIGTEEDIANQIKRELREAKELYNVSTDQSVGWLLYDEVKQFPNRETWESKEWKELTKKDASGKYVNQPAVDFYNYIRERNELYRDLGYINAKQSRVFLPWVRKGLTEKLVLGGNVTIGQQFLRNISIDEGDVGFGQRDPITGEIIDKVPIYFTRELEDEVSTDLFRTMSLYNEFALKYKYLSQIEDQVRALNRLEKNKQSIATSYWGKTEYIDGEIQYNPNNNENAQIIESMTKAIIYQQKFIQSDTFDAVLGNVGKVVEKINKTLGFTLINPEGLAGRQLSVNKSLDALNTTFQLQALGLNLTSSMSNLFGGTTQSLINSGRYFTKTDFVKAEGKLLWNMLNNKTGMGNDESRKFIGAMNFFMPFTENYNRDLAKKLSLSRLSQESMQDFLMVLMRNSDRAVQAVNFYAFLDNSIVVDNQVVNVREYLRQQPEYLNKLYEGTREERKARAEKFEKDVKKLVEEKGVLNISKIEGDQLVIPGVEQKSESVVEFRKRVQQLTADALGNMSEANRRLINLNIYGNSFMVFKNWIPRLIDVRYGNLKYNSASDAYEWGRMRTLVRFVTTDLIGALNSLGSSLLGNDEKFIQQIRELYEQKKSDYEKDTGKELEMTEDQFIDLVRANIKNQLLDSLIFLGLLALFLGLKANMPDEDEDPLVRNRWKYMLKITDKFTDEIAYFYNPTNIVSLVSTGIFPSLGLIDNYKKALKSFTLEMFGMAVGDEEMVEKNYPIKYIMKSFPITSQGAQLLPLFAPETAKDLGIRMPSQSGIR
jgi:hypothetical protein